MGLRGQVCSLISGRAPSSGVSGPSLSFRRDCRRLPAVPPASARRPPPPVRTSTGHPVLSLGPSSRRTRRPPSAPIHGSPAAGVCGVCPRPPILQHVSDGISPAERQELFSSQRSSSPVDTSLLKSKKRNFFAGGEHSQGPLVSVRVWPPPGGPPRRTWPSLAQVAAFLRVPPPAPTPQPCPSRRAGEEAPGWRVSTQSGQGS